MWGYGKLRKQKQSSRALFDTRRDTVKLSLFRLSGYCKNKVAVLSSSPQLTTMKLNKEFSLFFKMKNVMNALFLKNRSKAQSECNFLS